MALPWAARSLPLWGEKTPVIIEKWYENRIGLNFYQPRTPGCLLLKRQSSQRYVYSNTFCAFEQQNPVLKSKLPAIFYTGLKYFQQRINVCFLATKAREER